MNVLVRNRYIHIHEDSIIVWCSQMWQPTSSHT